MASSNSELDSNLEAQPLVLASSQATSYNLFANPRPGFYAESPKPLPTAMDQYSANMAQQHQYQQQQLQRQPHLQQYQQHSANMSQQNQHRAPQRPAQAQQQYQQRQFHSHPQRQQRYDSPINLATPSFSHNPRPTPEQQSKVMEAERKPLMVNTPSIHTTSGFINTTQQFPPHYRRPATPKPKAAAVTTVPSPRLTPVKRTHAPQFVSMTSSTPNMQYKVAPSTSVYKVQQNELAERARLEEEQQQRIKQYNKRRNELKSDASALYHSYSELLRYFPLGRSERPNTYLAGLLANQSTPAEPSSDRGVAIKFAKKHWQNYWELKDLKYVLQQAREDIDKETAQRRYMSIGETPTTRR